MDNYVCKIATLEEMNIKWDYEIEHNIEDRNNYIIWKENNIEKFKSGYITPYYGILNGKIICEATACFNKDIVQNSLGLVDENTVYLSAFRTITEYQGKGYFSKLMKYILKDLKNKGYKKVKLEIEPQEEKNKQIYDHFGFNEYIKSGVEEYPDGTKIDVIYYAKNL